jgi:hypothetical protein
MRCTALLLLALALAPAADAQEKKYEVALRRTSVVGDAIRRTRRNKSTDKSKLTRGGKVASQRDQARGFESVQTDEVLEVDGEDMTRGRRVYEKWADLESGKEAPVRGLVVEHVRAPDLSFSWKRVQGPEVPEFLAKQLDDEVKRMTKRAQEKAQGHDPGEAFFPTAEVAIGERWKVPLQNACESLGFRLEDVDQAASAVTGVLEQVEPEGDWRRVRVSGQLVLLSVYGRKSEPPGKFTIELFIRVRPGDVEVTYRTRGTLRGSYVDGPTGDQTAVESNFEQLDERVVIDPATIVVPQDE